MMSANPRYLQIPYLLRLTHNSKATLAVRLQSFVDVHRATETESPNVHVPSRGQAERPLSLPSGFSSHTVNKRPLHGPFSATVFAFLCLWVILLFEMVSEPSAEGLSGVPKPKEAVLGLAENSCVKQAAFRHESLCCCP